MGETARQALVRWFPDLGTAPPSVQAGALNVVEQVLLGGLTEAGGPYINKIFSMMFGRGLQHSAKRSLTAALMPRGSRAEGEALRVSEKLLEGPPSRYLAMSRRQLANRATEKVGDVAERRAAMAAGGSGLAGTLGQKLKTEEAKVAQELRPLQPILDSLEDYRTSLLMPPIQDTLSPGHMIQPNVLKIGSEEKLKALEVVKEKLLSADVGGLLSRDSLRAIRKSLDDQVRKSGANYAQGAMNAAGALGPEAANKAESQKHLGNILRSILNSDKPDIAKIGAEVSIWRSMQDALSPELLREEFTKETSIFARAWHARMVSWMLRSGLGAGAATAGWHAGGGSGAAAAVGAVVALGELTGSTAWRTVSAATKNQLATKLATGSYEDVARVATRLMFMKESVSDQPPTPGTRVALPATTPEPTPGSVLAGPPSTGEIRVRRKSDGRTGRLKKKDLNPDVYEQVQ